MYVCDTCLIYINVYLLCVWTLRLVIYFTLWTLCTLYAILLYTIYYNIHHVLYSFLDLLEHLFAQNPSFGRLSYLRLDGNTPVYKRESIIQRFNNDKHVYMMLLTTKTGGVGISLTGMFVYVYMYTHVIYTYTICNILLSYYWYVLNYLYILYMYNSCGSCAALGSWLECKLTTYIRILYTILQLYYIHTMLNVYINLISYISIIFHLYTFIYTAPNWPASQREVVEARTDSTCVSI